MAIRVIAVDDHHLILKGLSEVFREHHDIELVATSTQGSQLLSLVREHKPDIAILDLGMNKESFDPISTVRILHNQYPNVKVIILTGYDEGLWATELLKVGAKGYMLKSDDFSLYMPQAVRAVQNGGRFLSPEIAEKLMEDRPNIQLTEQEISVLNLLSQGLSTSAIASTLMVSNQRVRNILVEIYDKLEIGKAEGVSQRVSAINKARKLGLLHEEIDPL